MAAVTICSDFGAPPKIKSDTVSTVSPSICYEVMGPNASFKPTFSLFHYHQEALNSSSLSAIRVVSSACLRLLMSLGNIDSSLCFIQSNIFLMSVCKKKKKSETKQTKKTETDPDKKVLVTTGERRRGRDKIGKGD